MTVRTSRIDAVEAEEGMEGMEAEEVMLDALARMSDYAWFLLTAIGRRTGLWEALAGAGPLTAEEVAARAGLVEPYVREWLRGQAAAGFIAYDGRTARFSISPAVAAVVAGPDAPIAGFVEVGLAFGQDWPAVAADFTAGRGLAWDEHAPGYWEGLDAMARTVVGTRLATWIAALEGVGERLHGGGSVADVGCGFGWPTIVVAESFPEARVRGFDAHDAAIGHARGAADARGLGARVTFDVAEATRFPGSGYDLISFIDALHDLGDPTGALIRAREALAPGAAVLLVEAAAGDRVEENFHPAGVLGYTASVLACTPSALAQGGDPLGTLAGEARLREVAAAAGFSRIRRLDVDAPSNLLLELRP